MWKVDYGQFGLIWVGVDLAPSADGAASLVESDMVCSNGVVHVIDTILWRDQPERET